MFCLNKSSGVKDIYLKSSDECCKALYFKLKIVHYKHTFDFCIKFSNSCPGGTVAVCLKNCVIVMTIVLGLNIIT
jgi:hypothetical protein